MNIFNQWLNEAEMIKGEISIKIIAPPKTDYFINPTNGQAIANAPFYYTEVTGDFVLRAKVQHDFISTYDAAAFIVMDKDDRYAKLCFELTDLNTKAIVSVVTNGVSDDANGPNLDTNTVWMQIARKGQVMSMHYSLDGKKYDMVRLFRLEMNDTVKVGIVSQSPTGEGLTCEFSEIELEKKTLDDIRAGK